MPDIMDIKKKAQAKFKKHILLVMFGFGAMIGLLIPIAGKTLASYKSGQWSIVTTLCVCIIFFLQGLNLSTAAVKRAFGAWKITLFGIASILFITPLCAFIPLSLNFEVEEFRRGLAIFCNMPTTIASGIALVGQAGGNTAHALLLTVATNLLGIITVPFYLSLILTTTDDIDISPVPLLIKLLISILMPLFVGKGIQELSRYYEVQLGWINAFLLEHKFGTKMLTNFCLAVIVWMKFSQSASALLDAPGLDVFFLILAAIMLHAIMLAFNFGVLVLMRSHKTHPKEFRATLIMASQKTLPFAVTVIAFLDEAIGEGGLLTIPCIIMHLSQLFVDAYVAAYLESAIVTQEQPSLSNMKRQASFNQGSARRLNIDLAQEADDHGKQGPESDTSSGRAPMKRSMSFREASMRQLQTFKDTPIAPESPPTDQKEESRETPKADSKV